MISLTIVRRKVNFPCPCELSNKVTRLNHLLFMDDFKLFAKSHDENDPLVKTAQISYLDGVWHYEKCGIKAVIYSEGNFNEFRCTG